MLLKRNIVLGRVKIFFFVCILNQLITTNLYSDTKKTNEIFAELNILDKVSSKSSSIKIEIGKDFGTYRTVWKDSRYDSNEYGTKLIKKMVPDCDFDFPKSRI